MKERIYIGELTKHGGEEVLVAGWVHMRRDHGKLIFIDLRDETGKVQIVFNPRVSEDAHKSAEKLRSEWVVAIRGLIKERPEHLINKKEQNGHVEFEARDLEILSEAETPPFDTTSDTGGVGEETRLKYRSVDLRSERMQRNIRVRSEFVRLCRGSLFAQGFVEIETPLLTQSTPEGARDMLVPSRHNPGKFYALPQSPQQYKQLLMASGFERYFQVARCVRDEDLRADRGFEFSQIDIEMAFIEQNDVLNAVENMITETVEKMGYTIKKKPFPRFTHKEALAQFGAEKFDFRTDEEKKRGVLAYAWVTDFPFFEKTGDGAWTFTHNPFSMPKPEHLDWHLGGEHIEDIITQQYDLVCNGYESGGGSVRAHKPEILKATYKIMGYSDEEIERSVGHMLEAFSYGVPPHGGIALGVERNVMNLTAEQHLREVQAFPMTSGGNTAVMSAPSDVSKAQLDELGIEIKKRRE